MTSCELWTVVKVPFPYTDRPIRQHRPALVVARRASTEAPALLWALMITSAAHRRWPGDVEIAELSATGLPAPSIIRTAKIATIEESGAEPIGSLPEVDRKAVRTELAAVLEAALSAGA